jgi:hypothetical protein
MHQHDGRHLGRRARRQAQLAGQHDLAPGHAAAQEFLAGQGAARHGQDLDAAWHLGEDGRRRWRGEGGREGQGGTRAADAEQRCRHAKTPPGAGESPPLRLA